MKESKDKGEKKNMKKTAIKLGLASAAFGVGFGSALENTNTWAVAVTVGFYQGLKYNGNFKNGLAAGAVTLVTLATIDGIRTVILNRDMLAKAMNK